MTYFTVSKSNNVLTSLNRNYICWRGGTPPKPPPIVFSLSAVSVQLFIFASYFSRPISLENSRNPLYGSEGSFLTLRTNDIDDMRNVRYHIVHFATYLLSKIVLYIIYVIICTYMGINWHGPRTTDHRPRTTHFKSLLLPDITQVASILLATC